MPNQSVSALQPFLARVHLQLREGAMLKLQGFLAQPIISLESVDSDMLDAVL